MKLYELLSLAEHGCTCDPSASDQAYDEIQLLKKRFKVICPCDMDELDVTVSWEILKNVIAKNIEDTLL